MARCRTGAPSATPAILAFLATPSLSANEYNAVRMKTSVRLGPLTVNLLSPFPWKGGYPSSQAKADELERLLAFADSQGRLQNVPADFLSRLNTARTNQRDEALNELRVTIARATALWTQ